MKNNEKPLILITNDDGVLSPGVAAAARALADIGELLIAAPHTQHTTMARSYPTYPDSGVIDEIEIDVEGSPHTAYAVHGSPAFAVAHAWLELAPRPIDLCVSGVNYGENLGTAVSCSGTVGAAVEAWLHGIPSLAFSLEAPSIADQYEEASQMSGLDFRATEKAIRFFSLQTLERGLPPGVATLNINIPCEATPDTPYVLTRQSSQNYYYMIQPEPRDFSRPFMPDWKIDWDERTLEPDSDIYCFSIERKISVTPLTADMTAYARDGNPVRVI